MNLDPAEQALLRRSNAVVQGLAADTANEATEDAVQQLKSIVFAITSAGRHNKKLTSDEQTAIWELVCMLWVGLAAAILLDYDIFGA